MPDRADRSTTISCSPGLGGVLDEDQLVLFRDSLEGIHGTRVACQVDRDDCLRSRGDLALGIGGVEVVGVRNEISENRDSVLINDADYCADVCNRAGDDFIARSDTGRRHGDVQGGGAGGTCHDVFERADGFTASCHCSGNRRRSLSVLCSKPQFCARHASERGTERNGSFRKAASRLLPSLLAAADAVRRRRD